jgi:large subunit ribosomal protein L22
MEADPEKTAKAYGFELQCSPKDSFNIAKTIKGMKLKEAKRLLEDIIALKRPIKFYRYKRKCSHRKGHMGPGAYPKKAAECILYVLKNAENNAEYKGLDIENLVVSHISTYKGRKIEGIIPRAYGRATAKNEQTTNIEIILEEVEQE